MKTSDLCSSGCISPIYTQGGDLGLLSISRPFLSKCKPTANPNWTWQILSVYYYKKVAQHLRSAIHLLLAGLWRFLESVPVFRTDPGQVITPKALTTACIQLCFHSESSDGCPLPPSNGPLDDLICSYSWVLCLLVVLTGLDSLWRKVGRGESWPLGSSAWFQSPLWHRCALTSV